MQQLRYERPTTVAEATGLLAHDGARALAGGTDLIPQSREGRRAVSLMVDIKHIGRLMDVTRTSDGGWRIGAGVGITELGRIAELAGEHGALLDSARLIGSLQVQSRATLGGNLCNAAPSADGVPLLMALGASAEIAGGADNAIRLAPVSGIPTGPGRTSLVEGELVCALHLPPLAPRSAQRYLRFTPRREMDIAIAGAGVALQLAADGAIQSARIVLASVAPVPLVAEGAQALLLGAMPTLALFAAAGAKAAAEAQPISDARGSAAYRRELVAVLTRRALADCATRLGVSLA